MLPVAALLLRLGQPDLLNMPAIAAAGDAIFSNLGLLFAIGVAVGLARENHGAAGLASVVGYLVATHGARVLIDVPPEVTADLAGRAVDLAAAAFRAKELSKLCVPAGPALRRCSPAGPTTASATSACLATWPSSAGGVSCPSCAASPACALGLLFGFGWPALEHGMDVISQAVLGSESLGLFAYGVLNRVLIVTGLHHIINNIAWFLLGDYNGVTGDLKRFFAGDPTAGAFMSGFFPVMMFGLPGACLAMYRTAAPEKRKAVGGMLLSMALTSFLTGVTEPIEFAFMFLAPVLYAIHARAHRHRHGADACARRAPGVRIFRGPVRLRAQLLAVDAAVDADSRRAWRISRCTTSCSAASSCVSISRRWGARPTKRPRADPSKPADRRPPMRGSRRWARRPTCVRWKPAPRDCGWWSPIPRASTSAPLKALGSRGVLRLADGAVQVVVGPIADQLASEIRAALRRGARCRTVTAASLSASAAPPDPA